MKKRRFILTGTQFVVLSEICRDIAQIFFASIVVAPFLSVDSINWSVILSGGLVSAAYWIISILLVKKGEK
ncbi:MAG: hypothetical protein ACREHC_07995 [Candidatus Levyibacteriota bacterium]